MKYPFNAINIEKLNQEYSGNQNFIHNTLPRIKILHTIKRNLNIIPNLYWHVEYNHANVNMNRVTIHYQNKASKDFNFFYEIPLSLKFELRVFLANSSIHFIDLYNFLLENRIMTKNQFSIKAAYHTIPHFIINSETKRYNMSIINKHSAHNDLNENLLDEKVKNDIQSGFAIFNPIFDQLIEQFKI